MGTLKERLLMTGVMAIALLATIPIVFYYKIGGTWNSKQ